MTNKLYEKRPKNYGKDSRPCRHTGTTRGVIQKYGMNLSRKSFRELSEKIGFVKVALHLTVVYLRPEDLELVIKV